MNFNRRNIIKTISLSFLSVFGSYFLTSYIKNKNGRYVYRNINKQTRSNSSDPFYWTVRPFGRPNPNHCTQCEGFISEKVIFSEDYKTMIVETLWESKDYFLKALPPEHFEQPGFDEWHKKNGLTFTFVEDEIYISIKMT